MSFSTSSMRPRTQKAARGASTVDRSASSSRSTPRCRRMKRLAHEAVRCRPIRFESATCLLSANGASWRPSSPRTGGDHTRGVPGAPYTRRNAGRDTGGSRRSRRTPEGAEPLIKSSWQHEQTKRRPDQDSRVAAMMDTSPRLVAHWTKQAVEQTSRKPTSRKKPTKPRTKK